MSTHSFSVSGEPEAYLNTQVKRGYSKSGIIQDALRLKMEREAGSEDRLERVEARLNELIKAISGITIKLEIMERFDD